MDLLWALWVSMLTACVAVPLEGAGGSHSLFTCEPITLRMCQGLPYNSTFMPNALNHYDQQTAALAMEVRVRGRRAARPGPVAGRVSFGKSRQEDFVLSTCGFDRVSICVSFSHS